MNRLWIAALAALFFAPILSHAQANSESVVEGTPQYVTPVHPIPSGNAPGMKVQLLSDQNGQKEYAVIFSTGDEAFSGLTDFAKQYHVTSAHFTAIGAIGAATIGWFDPSRKMYKAMPFTGQMEVVSMVGDITLYNGKPAVHTHAVLGLPDGTTRGGHVLEMHVRPTLEVMVTVDPKDMHKRFDPETDLTLIDPSAHQ
jgi:predicted DNA-binding protein with PD1-like motif